MDQHMKLTLMRYYLSLTTDELKQHKADIGNLLRTRSSHFDTTDIKVSIEIINDELASRKEKE